jgi:chromosome segregation and condensation protein ScpB
MSAREDIQRLQKKVAALTQVLRSLVELLRGPNGTKLRITSDLASNIAMCSSLLGKLEEKMDPEISQSRMRRLGLRAFKWPLSRSEIENILDEIERYTTMFGLSLQVDQMYVL